MGEFEFRDPIFLAFALLAPLVYVLASRSASVVKYSSLSLLDGAPASWRVKLLPIPALMLAVATTLLAFALAGPRTADRTTKVHREGIAIMLVVDRSGSMNARDFVRGDQSVDRLMAVRSVLSRFLGGENGGPGRPDDLVGLIAFARYADSIAPLTLDHANLLTILDQLEIVRDQNEDGTAVGEGLGLAVERLRRHPAKSKIVILLTDGVSNMGDISPTQAADLAAAHGIKVYAVGAGKTGYAPFPVQIRGQTILRQAFVELDERSLQEIAARTAGRYFHGEDVEALEDVYREIDALERSEIIEIRYLRYEEHYAAFVLAGLVLMLGSALTSQSFLRRLP
ncbi:MAG: VWA domain-containing protein [Deltaproteobacteria bacterium]|nr:VWA domain-containing protein [Deltaproteobacteria bacterium]